MSEFEFNQSDFGESSDSENEQVAAPSEISDSAQDNNDRVDAANTKEFIECTERDQIQAIVDIHRENMRVYKEKGTQTVQEKSVEALDSNYAAEVKIDATLSSDLQAEDLSVANQLASQKDKPPTEQKNEQQLRIEYKEQHIANQKQEAREQVAQKSVVIVPEDTKEQRAEKMKEQEAIATDLKQVDMNAFYTEYFAIMRGNEEERPKKLLELESALGENLRAAAEMRDDPHAYDDVLKVNSIFQELTTSGEVERMAVILYQERLKIALEIELDIETKSGKKLEKSVSHEIQDIIRSDLPADQKLADIDSLLHQLSQIKTKDAQLQIKLKEFRTCNEKQDTVNVALELQLIEEHMTLERKSEDIKQTIKGINKNFPNMPEAGIKLFSDGVQEGYAGLVAAMLGGTVAIAGAEMLWSGSESSVSGGITEAALGGNLEPLSDGSYKGNIKGETVILERHNGRVVAYLEYGEAKIPIRKTSPDAVGFDLARSEKIAMEMGSGAVRSRLDVRSALLDRPWDSEFMNTRQANKFRAILHVVLRTSGADAEAALRKFSLLKENLSVNTKYVDALKNCFEAWAPEGNYESLLPLITEDDLLRLVALWKGEEQAHGEFVTLRTHTLAEIRNGKTPALS